MKENYKPVEMEVISFETEDIVTASGDCLWEGEEG